MHDMTENVVMEPIGYASNSEMGFPFQNETRPIRPPSSHIGRLTGSLRD
jgi:hypothetical protein